MSLAKAISIGEGHACMAAAIRPTPLPSSLAIWAGLSLWGEKLSGRTSVPGSTSGGKTSALYFVKAGPSMAALISQGAPRPVLERPAMKVWVVQPPKGAVPWILVPLRERPPKGVRGGGNGRFIKEDQALWSKGHLGLTIPDP